MPLRALKSNLFLKFLFASICLYESQNKTFQFQMYKKQICSTIETDDTCMEEITSRVMFVDPLGYEVT